jgi:hypothetical protein
MNFLEACKTLVEARGGGVIVATMSAIGALDQLEVQQPRLSCVPLMGDSATLALGLALACPREKVLVIDGDASLLLELGGLVTIAGARPRNLHHFVIENGVQFAGMANMPVPADGSYDLVDMARAPGTARFGASMTQRNWPVRCRRCWPRTDPASPACR